METTVNTEYQKIIDIIKSVKSATVLSSEMKQRLSNAIHDIQCLGSRPKLEDNVEEFMSITNNMIKTYAAKNHDYGNSFEQSLNKYGLTASIIRMGDKMNRMETLSKKSAEVKDETIRDSLLDLANYAIMTIMWLNNQPQP